MHAKVLLILAFSAVVIALVNNVHVAGAVSNNPNDWLYYYERINGSVSLIYFKIQPSDRDDFRYTFPELGIYNETDGPHNSINKDRISVIRSEAYWGDPRQQRIIVNNEAHALPFETTTETPAIPNAWFLLGRTYKNRVDVLAYYYKIEVRSGGLKVDGWMVLKLQKATNQFNIKYTICFSNWTSTYKELLGISYKIEFRDNLEDGEGAVPDNFSSSLTHTFASGGKCAEIKVFADWQHYASNMYDAILHVSYSVWFSDAVPYTIGDAIITVDRFGGGGVWLTPPGDYTNVTFPSWQLPDLPGQIQAWKGWLVVLLLFLVLALANEATAPYFATAAAVLLGVLKASGFVDPPNLVIGLLLAAGGLGLVVSRHRG